MAVQILDQLLIDLIHDLEIEDVRGFIRATNRVLKELCRQHAWRHYEKETTITLLASYTTGTVTMTNGSITVTGSGTNWVAGMVGRKFRISQSTGIYTVAAVNSTTELEIDVAWPYDTASLQSYTIYQDVYSLPSDLKKLLDLKDAVTGVPYEEWSHMDMVRNWNGYVYTNMTWYSPEMTWPPKFAFFGEDSSGNLQILVNSISSTSRVLDLFYERWPTNVTTVLSVPDISENMEECLELFLKRSYIKRMPQNTADQMNSRSRMLTEVKNEIDEALKKARGQDSRAGTPHTTNKRVMF